MIPAMASIGEIFRQYRYETRLYGQSVVDAYMILAYTRDHVQRRRPSLHGASLTHLIYLVYEIVYPRAAHG